MTSPAVAAGVLGSRQKNCNNCVQTKRRCDRRTPICSRCAERKVPCVYGKARVSHHTVHQQTQSSPHTEMFQFDSPDVSFLDTVTLFDTGCIDSLPLAPHPDAGPSSQTTSNACVREEIAIDDFMELVGNENIPSPKRWLVPVDENLPIERPGTPADEEIMIGYQKMASFCVGSMFRSHLSYS